MRICVRTCVRARTRVHARAHAPKGAVAVCFISLRSDQATGPSRSRRFRYGEEEVRGRPEEEGGEEEQDAWG